MSSRTWIAAAAAVVIATMHASPNARADGRNEVRAVTFDEDNGTTRVHVRGAETPTFTVYKLERPTRVVIDLPQSRLADALRGHESAAVLTPSTWAVSTIAAQQLDDGAVRVIVALARPGRYDVKTEGKEVVVAVMPRDPAPKMANADDLAKAQSEVERLRGVATAQEARAATAQRAADDAKKELQQQSAASASANAAAIAQAKQEAAKAAADAEAARTAAAKARADLAAAKAASDAEVAKSRAEASAAKADAERMKTVAAQATSDATRAKTDHDLMMRDAERARSDADKAKAEAERMKTVVAQATNDATRAKTDIDRMKNDAERARGDADKAKAEAERLKAVAEQATNDATRAKTDIDRMKAVAEKARSEADHARAEAERMKTVAEKATTDADHKKTVAEKATTDAERMKSVADKATTDAEHMKTVAEKATTDAEHMKTVAEKATTDLASAKTDAERAKRDAQAARAEAAADKRQAESDRKTAETARAQAENMMAESQRRLAEVASKAATAQELADKARTTHAAAQAREEAAREAEARAMKERETAELAAKRAQDARDRAAASDRTKAVADARAAEDQLAKARHATEEAEARRVAAEHAAQNAKQDLEHTKTALAGVEQQRAAIETAASEAARKRSEAEAAASDAARRRGEAEMAAADASKRRSEAEHAAKEASKQRGEAEQQRAAAEAQRVAAERMAREAEAAAKTADKQRAVAEAATRTAMAAKSSAEASLAELTARRTSAERAATDLETRMKAETKAKAAEAAAEARSAGAKEIAAARAEVARLADERKRAESELADKRKAVAAQQAESARLEIAAAQAKDAANREEARRAKLAAENAKPAPVVVAATPPAPTPAAKPAPVVAAATPAAPTPAAAKPSAKTALVKDINFRGGEGSGEISLKLEGNPDIKIGEVTAQHVEVIVDGAELGPKLERTLDVSQFGSPIRQVSSFRDRRTPNRVRLVAELSQPVTPTLDRDAGGAQLRFALTERRVPPHTTVVPSPVVGGFGAVSTPIAQRSVSQVPPAPAAPARGGRQRIYHGATVDFDFKNAPIHDLLRIIGDTGHVSIVVPDSIEANVTVRLKRVPWDQALDVILASHGLGYRREGNIYRIATKKELDTEDAEEAARREAAVKAEAPKPEVITLNYASAEELKNKLEPMLSPKGKIETDGRTNALIVNDVGYNRHEISRLALELDTQTPQITIEARIVEARSNFVRQFGVQWGGRALAGAGGGNATGLVWPSSIGLVGGNEDQNTRANGVSLPSDFAVNIPANISTGEGGALGISLGSIGGNFNLNFRLSALEDTGTVRIISAPKITVLNNKEAFIKQGVSIPISVVSAAGTQTQFVQADLQLKVTPYVSQRDCAIAMTLDVTKNEPDFVNVGARGDPTILRKEAHTVMLVNDGETTVLGGIYTRNSGLAYKKIPFFGDLPFLGWLFKNRRENDDRTEVLVFITPRITNKASLRCVQ